MVNQESVRVTELGMGGIWVEGIQASACGSCSANAGCGQHTLSKLGRPVRLWIDTEDTFSVGEVILLTLPQGSLAISAVVLYGLPLIGLIAGAVLGQYAGGDVIAVLSSLVGLASGLLVARLLSAKYHQEWQPTVSRERDQLPS